MAENIDREKLNLIYKMSSAFFSMFSEYNPFIVEKALDSLSKLEKKTIFLLYGLDGEQCLDYDEIADKLNLSTEEVIDKTEKIMKALLKVNGLKEKRDYNLEKTEDSTNEESKRNKRKKSPQTIRNENG